MEIQDILWPIIAPMYYLVKYCFVWIFAGSIAVIVWNIKKRKS